MLLHGLQKDNIDWAIRKTLLKSRINRLTLNLSDPMKKLS